MNLTPVFGAVLAVVLLGEPFSYPEATALQLVTGGIFIAEDWATCPGLGLARRSVGLNERPPRPIHGWPARSGLPRSSN